MDSLKSVTITRTFERPVTTRERLGSVPGDCFERTSVPMHGIGSITHTNVVEDGNHVITRTVPVYDEGGKPKMESVTETLSAKPYNATARAVKCGAVAAVIGLLVAGTGPIGWAAAGAAAAAGAVLGQRTARNDAVSEQSVEHPILHPKMKGNYHVTVPVPIFVKKPGEIENEPPKKEVKLLGYFHHFQPDIENTKVGSFQEPALVHERHTCGLAAGLLAAGAGAVVAGALSLVGNRD